MLLLSTMVLKEGMRGRKVRMPSRRTWMVISKAPKVAMARALQSTIGLGDDIHGSEEVLDKEDGEVVTSHTHRGV